MGEARNTARSQQRVHSVIRRVTFLGIPTHLVLMGVFHAGGARGMAIATALGLGAWAVAFMVNDRGSHSFASWLLAGEVIGYAIVGAMSTGWEAGFQFYLFGAIPFLIFNTQVRGRWALVAAAACGGTFLVLYLVLDGASTSTLGAEAIRPLFALNSSVALAAVAITSYYFRTASLQVEGAVDVIAHTDELTQLLNRRGIEEHLAHLAKRANLTVALCDIDHFKAFNDNFGHDCGDEVLRSVAKVLRETLRANDVVGRWGGEEFAIALPDSTPEQAVVVLERVRAAIAAHLVFYRDRTHRVTLTFGAARQETRSGLRSALRAADQALYRGKSDGRDRVALAPEAGRRWSITGSFSRASAGASS